MPRSKQGWYELTNPEKFIKPIDDYMKSFKDGFVNYKSGLELTGIRYVDTNPKVKCWSLEPFNIKYIKPTDKKIHRYFIDLYIEMKTGHKFLVEIKSSSETVKPKPPKKQTAKAKRRYAKMLETYAINTAKWNAAREVAKKNGFQFIFLTEKELGHSK